MDTTIPPDFGREVDTLLALAGRQALANPTPEAFRAWFRQAAPAFMPSLVAQLPPQTEAVDQLLGLTALDLFADLPQPGHGLRPAGLPQPGRNDPCFCGSGRKFKHCCGAMSMPPLFRNMNLLRYVLDAYPKTRLREVAASQAAIDAVADTALQWLDDGDAARAAALLEPYFAGSGPLTVRLAPLFHALMETWLALDRRLKRKRLIDAVLQRGDRPLQSDAQQRLASMLADEGDHAGAWQAFRRAQELNPNDPALSFLEVTLLLNEGRIEEAKSRAQWWAASLARQRDPELADMVARLREIARDPHAGMLGMAASAHPDLGHLLSLLQTAPAPVARQGFDLATQDTGPGGTRAVATDFEPDARLARLEQRWRQVFPQAKPHLTAVQNDAEQVWDHAPQWLDLLEKHPDLWFSFDVLDDLVMAADTVPWDGVVQRLLVPLAERATEQLRVTLEARGSEPLACPWAFMSHRPALRPVAHLAFVCKEAGNWPRFMELAHWLVFELNPNDNHGLRNDLSHACVRFERWADVLALQSRYPHDASPVLVLNAVLALRTLGDPDRAATLLRQARQDHPVAVRMLLQAAPPKPVKPDSPYGILVGGRHEAWLYVSEMREHWERHQALDWARQALKPARGKPRPPKPDAAA